jgi:hypothetical protein
MNTQLRKFLVAGTALCLSVAPALAAGDNGRMPMEAARTSPAPTANIGEIDQRSIAAYQARMRSAMAITDPPRRDAVATAARQQLAQNIHKPLSAGTIAELDGLLDIGGISPQLGATG